MKTLDDALRAGEAPEVTHRNSVGVVQYRCQADGCRCWRPAFALRDVRLTSAFGDAAFVCDECEGRVRRSIGTLFSALEQR